MSGHTLPRRYELMHIYSVLSSSVGIPAFMAAFRNVNSFGFNVEVSSGKSLRVIEKQHAPLSLRVTMQV